MLASEQARRYRGGRGGGRPPYDLQKKIKKKEERKKKKEEKKEKKKEKKKRSRGCVCLAHIYENPENIFFCAPRVHYLTKLVRIRP